MNRRKGYMGLIAILVVALFIVLWMLYLWNNDWFGNKLRIDENISDINSESEPESAAIDAQLNDLRDDVRYIQDRRDQEIFEAMDEINN